MTHPQQPEFDRTGLGANDQRGDAARAPLGPKAPSGDEGGEPTPRANATADERRSGSASTTRDALER